MNGQARVTWFNMVAAISLSGRTISAAPSLMASFGIPKTPVNRS